MILLDVTQTSHTHAQTGVQRVCRGIYFALKRNAFVQVIPILWDPYMECWRKLFRDELAVLEQHSSRAGTWKRRGAHWSLFQKSRSLSIGLLGRKRPLEPDWKNAQALIVPEIFSEDHFKAYKVARNHMQGESVLCAIFHDAMAVDHPEHTDLKSVEVFDAYLRVLGAYFDLIAPNSLFSKTSILNNFKRLGITPMPRIASIPLGVDPVEVEAGGNVRPEGLKEKVILSVGTLEGRKNHVALLDACENLWSQGYIFQLILAGGANKRTGQAALEKIASLKALGHPIEYRGSVSEATLQDYYRRAYFTVYPSICEGFGLPIVESIQYGKPCITGSGGALRETGDGGGVICLDSVDAASLAREIGMLLSDASRYEYLRQKAVDRPVKTWGDYAQELLEAL